MKIAFIISQCVTAFRQLTTLTDERRLLVAASVAPAAPLQRRDQSAVLISGPAVAPEPEGGLAPVAPRPGVLEQADPRVVLRQQPVDRRVVRAVLYRGQVGVLAPANILSAQPGSLDGVMNVPLVAVAPACSGTGEDVSSQV